MQLAKLFNMHGLPVVGKVDGDQIAILDLAAAGFADLSALLAASDPSQAAAKLATTGERIAIASARLLPPIDSQEVWAAGVTYKRSQTARMEESETAASCYDRVYASPRPEIFFSASPVPRTRCGVALTTFFTTTLTNVPLLFSKRSGPGLQSSARGYSDVKKSPLDSRLRENNVAKIEPIKKQLSAPCRG